MASVDLKDVFFTVPIRESHQKYFKLEWKDKVYKFVGMPKWVFWCHTGIYKDSKILRFYLQRFCLCRFKTKRSLICCLCWWLVFARWYWNWVFRECGSYNSSFKLLKFYYSRSKVKIMKLTQRIEFLGFIIDSTKVTVTVSKDKMIAITNKVKNLMAATFPAIRQLASVTGSVICKILFCFLCLY